MKKALIISYRFPPLGGGGVQRTLKFVKYLNNFGYEPIVITTRSKNLKVEDHSLLKELPKDIKVLRFKSYDILNLLEKAKKFKLDKIISFISKYVLIPDSQLFWQYNIRKKVKKLIDEENIDIVYTTSAPYSTHLIGKYLKNEFDNLKWVADFRDEWTTNPYIDNKANIYNKLRLKIESYLESEVCKFANKIIVLNDEMRSRMSKNNLISRKKFETIPNGFDKEDFDFMKNTKTIRNDNKITFSYMGSFYGERKPDNIFHCFGELFNKELLDKNKVEIKIIGNYNTKLMRQKIKKYSLENVVKLNGYLPHKSALIELYKSDVLLLIIADIVGSERIYTGKLFEYIKLGKPILALIPPNGVAADVIRKTNTGEICNNENFKCIEEKIKKIYSLYFTESLNYNFNKNEIKKYRRKNQTKKLSEVFDSLQVI